MEHTQRGIHEGTEEENRPYEAEVQYGIYGKGELLALPGNDDVPVSQYLRIQERNRCRATYHRQC